MPLADVSPPMANIQAHLNDDAMDHLFAEKVFEETMAFKTRMCTYITKKQTCPYGDRCRFAHCAKDSSRATTTFWPRRIRRPPSYRTEATFPDMRARVGAMFAAWRECPWSEAAVGGQKSKEAPSTGREPDIGKFPLESSRKRAAGGIRSRAN